MGLWNQAVLAATLAYFRRTVNKRPPIPLASVDMDRVDGILLVSNTAIGDTLLSTPAIRAVKKSFPNHRVGLVCHARSELLVRYNPYVDRLHVYRSKFHGMRSLVNEIRTHGYGVAVILHGNDPETVPMCYVSGIRTIIGTETSKFRFLTSDPSPVPGPFVHATEQRLEYVRALGAVPDGVHMDLVTSAEAEQSAGSILEERFGSGHGPVVALHPAGSGPYKWWPADRFVHLADRLWDRFGAGIAVVCGARESELGAYIARRTSGPAFSTGGACSLLEVAGLLKRSALLVTTDSGPMHMGLALGTPTLALIGADHPARIGPYGVDRAEVLYKKDEVCPEPKCLRIGCRDNVCLKAIQVEEVWNLIVQRFSEVMAQ